MQFVATRSVAIEMCDPEFETGVAKALNRFMAKDWGECSEMDCITNNQDVSFAMGSYTICGKMVWIKRDETILNEGDTEPVEVVTVMFPEDY